MINTVDHINIVVSDLERSLSFYTKVLGFKEVRRAYLEGEWVESIVGLEGVRAHVAYVIAPAGGPRLELLCYGSPTGDKLPGNSRPNTLGLRHLALQVDDIDAAVRRLKGAKAELISEPVVVPTDVITHHEGHKVLCYFLDPDGVLLELTEYR